MTPVNTHAKTLNELLGNGIRYRVPLFQRDYSWGSEEWEDLWFDLEEMLDGDEPAHYMGYLVRQPRGTREFDIIDGQQRLTTLTLLILAGLQTLKRLADAGHSPDENRQRIEAIRQGFVGTLDLVSLVSSPKLTLNKATNDFFQDYLIPLRTPLPKRGLREGQKQLRDAFLWLADRVSRRFAGVTDGAQVAAFLRQVADGLFFTVIDVDSELNAFKVFETLNARGVQLSPTDLLKNRLFSIVHGDGGLASDRDIEQLQRRWDNLNGALAGERLTDFLRAHWNSRHPQTRRSQLFKAIRAQVQSREAVFDLLRALEDDVEAFAARRHPDDAFWTTEQRAPVDALHRAAVRQPWPLLLAARRRFDDADFTRLLRACEVIAVRYNVIGRRLPADQERTFNQVAQHISAGELTTPRAVILALAPIYPSDAEFRADFAAARLRTGNGRNKKVARYLLAGLARHDGQAVDADDRLLSLEHVLPDAPPESGWEAFDDDAHALYRHRLGNYVLLETSLNRGLGQADWPAKREALARSSLAAARALADEDAWTPDAISARQKAMARAATAVWRLSELS